MERPPHAAVARHQREALVVVERVPVVRVAPALRHRVEAEGRLPLGGQLGIEACLLQLVGQPRRVLRHLGERDIGGDDLEPRGPNRRLEAPEPPQIGAEHHEGDVRLVAEDRRGDDLVPPLARLGRGAEDPRCVEGRPGAAEQVQHADARGRRHRGRRHRGGRGIKHPSQCRKSPDAPRGHPAGCPRGCPETAELSSRSPPCRRRRAWQEPSPRACRR